MPLPSVENCDGALLNGALRRRISVPLVVPGASKANSIALPENRGSSRIRRSSTTWPSDASAVERIGVTAGINDTAHNGSARILGVGGADKQRQRRGCRRSKFSKHEVYTILKAYIQV